MTSGPRSRGESPRARGSGRTPTARSRPGRFAAALAIVYVWAAPAQASSAAVAGLLHEASRLAAGHRASDPAGDEVIDAYRRVLAVDAKNEAARQALADITVRCAALIERAEALEQTERAQQLADRVRRRLADTVWRVRFMADKGSAEAELTMGVLHRRGILVTKSPESSCDYYQRAARGGQPAAQYRYGLCIAKRNRKTAIEWIRKAAQAGHPAAQHLLGEMDLGSGDKHVEQGAHWVALAAEQGRPSAQSLLGWLYATGTGVPKDLNRAFELYLRAAKAGVPSAQNNLAELYETGGVGTRDESRAAYWYRRAAQTGFPPAEFNLGRLYVEGKGVPEDEDKARAWLRRARERGVGDAGKLLDWLDRRNSSRRATE
jgi:TPR repeat protein